MGAGPACVCCVAGPLGEARPGRCPRLSSLWWAAVVVGVVLRVMSSRPGWSWGYGGACRGAGRVGARGGGWGWLKAKLGGAGLCALMIVMVIAMAIVMWAEASGWHREWTRGT